MINLITGYFLDKISVRLFKRICSAKQYIVTPEIIFTLAGTIQGIRPDDHKLFIRQDRC